MGGGWCDGLDRLSITKIKLSRTIQDVPERLAAMLLWLLTFKTLQLANGQLVTYNFRPYFSVYILSSTDGILAW